MNIQWYPGHMAKTKRLLKENLTLVDIVIELLDARIPSSSRNPDLDELLQNKPRVIAMNKYDLADPTINGEWTNWYKRNNLPVVCTDSIHGKGIKELLSMVYKVLSDKLEREKARGRRERPIRTMVVGIPNVGKSAFINRLAGKASAKTGDRPGVTRAKQWVRINPQIQLLDTPGILWPKFEDVTTGLNLAFTGAVKDEINDVAELAIHLLEVLKDKYPKNLIERYKLEQVEDKTGLELLTDAGRKRGCIISGGEIDYYRAANIILDDFRAAKIGRISLERPEL